eukprot:Gb_07828 [translate_table: standard]
MKLRSPFSTIRIRYTGKEIQEFVMTTAVQRLYELCNETFSTEGVVPPPPAIHRLRSLLDTITPVDVGVDEHALIREERRNANFAPKRRRRRHSAPVVDRWPPPVTLSSPSLSTQMGIFCLPTSAVIPLHDHPGMTVLSKVLFGSMHIKAYDWLPPVITHQYCYSQQSRWRLANLKIDTVFTAPCEASVLYPTGGGNIHSFTGVTSCAVLDVLSPPYSDDRDSTYYRHYPYLSLSENENKISENYQRRVWLEEVETPDDFLIRVKPYKGPTIECTS